MGYRACEGVEVEWGDNKIEAECSKEMRKVEGEANFPGSY